MSQSATPAAQNDMTACFETLNKDGFRSFPYTIDTATAPQKPATRDETCWTIKTSISCETWSNFIFCSFKIDVFLRVFLRTDLEIDVSCEASVDFHDMSQNATLATQLTPCHHFAQRWQWDSQENNTTRLKCCARHAKWHRNTSEVSKVLRLPLKMQRIFWECSKSIAPATQRLLTRCETCWHVTKCHACRAKRHDSLFWNIEQRWVSQLPLYYRQCDGTTEASDSRRNMLDHQNQHFVRDLVKFHILQLQNRRFPTSFLTDRPRNRRFVRGFRWFSGHVTKCHACHAIDTLSPLRAALTMGFAKNSTTRLKCCACHAKWHRNTSEVSKVLRLPLKMQRIFFRM